MGVCYDSLATPMRGGGQEADGVWVKDVLKHNGPRGPDPGGHRASPFVKDRSSRRVPRVRVGGTPGKIFLPSS